MSRWQRWKAFDFSVWYKARKERISYEKRQQRYEEALTAYNAAVILHQEKQINSIEIGEAFIEYQKALAEIEQDDDLLWLDSDSIIARDFLTSNRNAASA